MTKSQVEVITSVQRRRHRMVAWSTKRYLSIELLKDQQMRGAITA
jgi:hypothetical protein